MTSLPLKGLIMRTAVARLPGLGYIYAADPKKEAEEIPHAITFKYKDGTFTRGEANYDAHSLTLVSQPEFGLIAVSGAGYYSAIMSVGQREHLRRLHSCATSAEDWRSLGGDD